MTYTVKTIYFTLQGEGALAGRPAVFLRFAGCNLWTGREADRAAAVCRFCDTDFVGTDGPGGGKFTAAEALAATHPDQREGQKLRATRGRAVVHPDARRLEVRAQVVGAIRDLEPQVVATGLVLLLRDALL